MCFQKQKLLKKNEKKKPKKVFYEYCQRLKSSTNSKTKFDFNDNAKSEKSKSPRLNEGSNRATFKKLMDLLAITGWKVKDEG